MRYENGKIIYDAPIGDEKFLEIVADCHACLLCPDVQITAVPGDYSISGLKAGSEDCPIRQKDEHFAASRLLIQVISIFKSPK